jgi:fatty acyl-CoA reductase
MAAFMAPASQQPIAERLAGKTVLLTGGSGFLGKTILCALLRGVPDIGQLRLLLRGADDAAARLRLSDEVRAASVFAEPPYGERFDAALENGRLDALCGDVRFTDLGRSEGDAPLRGVDVLIHCAASVSFEQPLDEMLELNVLGPLHVTRAVVGAGSEPEIVHVSTAFAAGTRTGLVLERPSGEAPAEPDVDLDAELAAARMWRAEIEAESRRPEHQRRFVADAAHELGPAGGPAIGARAEDARRGWLARELSERGRDRARALGWSDGYGLSKALAERALLAEGVRPLSIMRPSIIESALRDPYPGWIEGIKVADPIILAYAQGLVPRFPANPSVRFDLIPVDLVANACVVAAAYPPGDGVRTVALVTGTRNPLTIEDSTELITDYFRERPLPDAEGLPVYVPDWRFQTRTRIAAALDRGERALSAGRWLLDRTAVPRAHQAERRLHRERRSLERVRRLAEVYGPYAELDCLFDDRHARELEGLLAEADRDEFDFDPARLHWPTYFQEIHLPALRELVAPAPSPPPGTKAAPRFALPDGPPALAVFDVEGVLLDATVAHFYHWLRGRDMPVPDRATWSAALATRVPGYLVADRRSRATFSRVFYRNYRGLPAHELRDAARAALSEFILPRLRHEAVRRIRAHRRRGDHVVLVTGALDFLVAALEHLADELVAARLVERRGSFTGELAEPPLTADGRASLAAGLAADHGVELGDCYAYADAISDLPMLEVVGHPHAVNPDFRLAREARRRGWPLLDWPVEPGAGTAPPAPIEVPA